MFGTSDATLTRIGVAHRTDRDGEDFRVAQWSRSPYDVRRLALRGREGDRRVDGAARLIEGLGGPDNVVGLESCVLRVRVEVHDPARVDSLVLRIPEVLAVVRSDTIVQIVVGPGADVLAAAMEELLGSAE